MSDAASAHSPLSQAALAISSQKGGVGKTTTCLSLGAALVEMGLRVLLVDLDPQAHLTQALGVDPQALRSTVGDVLLQQASLLQVSRSTSQPDLDLVPANNGLLLVEKILYAARGYEFRMRDALNGLAAPGASASESCYYDLLLYDCPPSFGPLTVNALSAAAWVITPLTCDHFARQSLESYLKLLQVVRRHSNPALQQRLLVTMFDRRTRLSAHILEEYRQQYQAQFFETLISLDVRLRESPTSGRPITAYASGSRGAQEYRSLARELITCLNLNL